MTGWSLDFDGDRVQAALDEAADEAAYAAGEHLLQVSRAVVPIEETTLEQSGRVTDPEYGSVNVLYDTPYAVVQHEDMTLQHDPGRQAKYLEEPMHREADTLRRIVADKMAVR